MSKSTGNITLPEDVLASLSGVDPDLSRAVVRVAQPEMAGRPHPPAELVAYGSSISTLEPGDLISCGTNHQQIGPVQDGETVTIEITYTLTATQERQRVQVQV